MRAGAAGWSHSYLFVTFSITISQSILFWGIMAHTLLESLRDLRGNSRAVVYTEPLWGIAYNLFIPYLSIYMLALGLSDSKIGLVTSIGLGCQLVCALLGGAITDKLGRRYTTFIFDMISWSAACLVWAFAKDFNWFVAAIILNSLWRISMTSWPLLLAEDEDHSLLVDMYTWVYIFTVTSAFFTPLTGYFIGLYGLIPTMRVVFMVACGLMTSKFVILFFTSKETSQGKVRLADTKMQSLFSILKGYGNVFRQVLRTPQTLYLMGILVINVISNQISGTFWSIFVTQRLQVSDAWLAAFPFARSIFMLIFFFAATPLIRRIHFRKPMLLAYAGFITSQVILISLQPGNYIFLLISVAIEACSYAVLNTQIDRLLIIAVDPNERARIVSILSVAALAVSSPFGWIAGLLSQTNRALPFVLTTILLVIGGLLTVRFAKDIKATTPVEH